MKANPKRHPIQPVYRDKSGVLRFKPNPIVNFMVDELTRRGFNLNDLHAADIEATKHDWDQFNQLIGYSVSNCPILDELTSYRANAMAEKYVGKFAKEAADE